LASDPLRDPSSGADSAASLIQPRPRFLDEFDRRPVRRDLAQRLGDLAAVEAKADDRVGTRGSGHFDKPADGILARLVSMVT
jgi:hypothetical protein